MFLYAVSIDYSYSVSSIDYGLVLFYTMKMFLFKL
jgi:hypothetical protein